jgi:hypothetical protein
MPILANLAYQPIAFDVPNGHNKEAKSVNTGPLLWAGNTQYTLDPTQSNQLLEMQNIQSVFIDNSQTTGTTLITVATTGHTVRVPPLSQGFFPLIAGDRPVIVITNTSGNGSSQAWILNIPALPDVWSVGAGAASASVISGDTGNNALLTARGRLEVPFTTTIAAALATTDVSNYSWVSVHTTSQGTGSVLAFQASNDGVNWVGAALNSVAATGSSAPSVSTGSPSMYAGPLSFRYFRLNVTGIAAGTTAGTVEFFTLAPATFGSQISLAAGTNSIGNASIFPTALQIGLAPYKLISAATTNANVVKVTAGQLYHVWLGNTAGAARFVKFYNRTTAPTVGTDVPTLTYMIPAGASLAFDEANGISFGAGIALAITAGMADTDATAIGANEVAVNLGYK